MDHAKSIWLKALSSIQNKLPGSIRTLDVGAGTGFASQQVIKSMGDRIDTLILQDISTDMLQAAQMKIGSVPYVQFDSQNIAVFEREQFDLIVSNAILHHILEIDKFVDMLVKLLKPGGFWVCGHEPNANFYTNRFLMTVMLIYRKYKRMKRLFSWSFWARKIGRVEVSPSIVALTNQELLTGGLVSKPLPSTAIQTLVDIHVPRFGGVLYPWQMPGINAHQLLAASGLVCVFYETYSHVKDIAAYSSPLWRAITKTLNKRFPLDGADFIAIGRKPT